MVFLGIGGNIGNKQENFLKVFHLIENKTGKIVTQSSVYETPPWGFHSDHVFWNQVFEVDTRLTPEKLLEKIYEIEKEFKRERGESQYSNREMDIDILYFDDEIIETDKLIIPHPKIQLRKFVLVPLVEIAPDFRHPLIRLTNFELLNNCKDGSVIKKLF